MKPFFSNKETWTQDQNQFRRFLVRAVKCRKMQKQKNLKTGDKSDYLQSIKNSNKLILVEEGTLVLFNRFFINITSDPVLKDFETSRKFPPFKLPPRKLPPGKLSFEIFPPFSLSVFTSLFVHKWGGECICTSSSLNKKFRYLQNGLEFSHKSFIKTFMQSIFSALYLQYKVSMQDQIAISQYHS